jgi:hypothetical protein
MAYVTAAELKDALGITDTADDAHIQRALDAAEEAVIGHCDRFFDQRGSGVSPQQRIYKADLDGLDDIVSISAVEVDTAGDGTYATATTDYTLEPFNAVLDGEPYTRLVKGSAFPAGKVRISGVFGWPSVPAAVEQAMLLQASRFFKRLKEAPFGVAGVSIDGAGIRLLAKLDADVELLLSRLQKYPVVVA